MSDLDKRLITAARAIERTSPPDGPVPDEVRLLKQGAERIRDLTHQLEVVREFYQKRASGPVRRVTVSNSKIRRAIRRGGLVISAPSESLSSPRA